MKIRCNDDIHDEILLRSMSIFISQYDGGLLTVINRTLEPGTPVEMCVSYDANLTRCEYTAVADKGFYSDRILQVDVDAEKQQSRFRGAK